MSKFNIALKYIKKYVFWVISIICLLVTMIVGSTITGNRAENFKSRESAIESRFSEMQSLAGQDTPNAVVVAQKKEDVINLKDNIIDAWNKLYLPQSQLFVDRWPEFRGDVNAADFQHALQDVWEHQSIYESKNSLTNDVADAYRNYVNRFQARDFMERYKIYIPKLLTNANGAMEAPIQDTNNPLSEGELPSEGNIVWDETSRQQMLNRFRLLHSTAAGRANSTRKILLVQEDIWIYDILLNAIAQMNQGCEGAHDAVIKRIFEIDVAEDASSMNTSGENGRGGRGRTAAVDSLQAKKNVTFKNSEERVVSVAAPVRTGDEELDEAAMANPEELEEEEGAASGDEEFEFLFDYRYCDAYGNFMSAAQLTEFLKTRPEYKMMPVHVKVLIHQDQIPQFMLNCMNAKMPIYVHQISIQARDYDSIPHNLEIIPEAPTSTAEEGGALPAQKRSKFGEGGTGMMDRGMMGTGMGTETMGMNGLNGEKDERKPEDVELDLWGMVCIFNKPDISKFDDVAVGEEEGAEESDAEDSGDSEDANAEDAENSGDEDAESSEDAEESDPEAGNSDAEATEEKTAEETNSAEEPAANAATAPEEQPEEEAEPAGETPANSDAGTAENATADDAAADDEEKTEE